VASIPSRPLIVGLGTSGLAAVHLAVDRGADVVVTDRRPEDELAEALAVLPSNVEVVTGSDRKDVLAGRDALILSPGVPFDAPLVVKARGLGLPVLSEVEFAWRIRPEAPLTAVTGSNGKSTVTSLVATILEDAGRRVAAGGNLGVAASQLVLEGGWDEWVLEISSFQAEAFTQVRPEVGLFLNLSQDHLERHGSMAEYAAAKRRLFANQGPGDTAVLNADDPVAAATPVAGRRRLFSLTAETTDGALVDGALVVDGTVLATVQELRLTGRHNHANALAAALAVGARGVDREAIAATLRTFTGLDHRHTLVHEADGVRWVDDSKATNVGAALAAMDGYPDGSVHLILGGLGKDQDFGSMAATVARVAARTYLIGRDAEIIAAALGTAPVEHCGTLEAAVAAVRDRARPGQVVLLAPACASFDQFAGFAERGARFTELARAAGGGR
jgi:UDP-N-acetylmuramoylalanine--D-glutamate ligase